MPTPKLRNKNHFDTCFKELNAVSRDVFLMLNRTTQKNKISVDKKGFTLLEILIAMTIMGIFTGVALVNFSKPFRQIQLNRFKNDLLYTLYYAQQRAIVKELNLKMVYDEASRGFWLEEKKSDSNDEFSRLKGRFGRKILIPAHIDCKLTQPEVLFDSDGSATPVEINCANETKGFLLTTSSHRGTVTQVEFRI